MSEITLALLEDSGFYKVDYGEAMEWRWGKDVGCDFVQRSCVQGERPTWSGICTPQDIGSNQCG